MSENLIGAVIGAVATILAAIIGLIAYSKFTNRISVKQSAKGKRISQTGISFIDNKKEDK